MIDATQSEAAGRQQRIRRGHQLISNKVVQLDKVLYGTVGAASLWYNELKGKLEQY